jgi:hypothetical protein
MSCRVAVNGWSEDVEQLNFKTASFFRHAKTTKIPRNGCILYPMRCSRSNFVASEERLRRGLIVNSLSANATLSQMMSGKNFSKQLMKSYDCRPLKKISGARRAKNRRAEVVLIPVR